MSLPHIRSFGTERLTNDHFQQSDTECDICKSAEAAAIDNPQNLPTSSTVKIRKCGHVFHELCLSTWLEMQVRDARHGTCPSCRHVLVQNSSVAERSVLDAEGRYVPGYWWCTQDEFEESFEDTPEEEQAHIEQGIMQIRERIRSAILRLTRLSSQPQSTAVAASRAEAQEDLSVAT